MRQKLNGFLVDFFVERGSEDYRKLHLVNCDTMYASDYEGGLGILDFGDMNETLTTKWIYDYANNREALWRKLSTAEVKAIRAE